MKARFSQLMGAATVLAITAPQQAANAGDIFLKLTNLSGDSVATNHKGEIEIESFSMDVSRASSVGSGGITAGKTYFSDMHVQARMSSVSPKLARICATGESIPTATLSVQRTTAVDKAVDYYQVTLSDVRITSVSTRATDGGGRPEESYSLSFTKVEWVYKPSAADGKSGLPDVKAGYDITVNKATSP